MHFFIYNFVFGLLFSTAMSFLLFGVFVCTFTFFSRDQATGDIDPSTRNTIINSGLVVMYLSWILSFAYLMNLR